MVSNNLGQAVHILVAQLPSSVTWCWYKSQECNYRLLQTCNVKNEAEMNRVPEPERALPTLGLITTYVR